MRDRELFQHQLENLNIKAPSGWVRGFTKGDTLSIKVSTTHTTPQEVQFLNGGTRLQIQFFQEFYERPLDLERLLLRRRH